MIEKVSHKNNDKFKLNLSNTYKILKTFIQDPERCVTYKDIREFVSDVSETQIRVTLSGLERFNILDGKGIRGRPKGGDRLKEYRLPVDLKRFERILPFYIKSNTKEFFESQFVTLLLKDIGFVKIMEIIENHLRDPDLSEIISDAIIGQQPVRDEFVKYKYLIKKDINSCYGEIEMPTTAIGNYCDFVKALQKLKLSKSINFYKILINKSYISLYYLVTSNKIMKKYTALDITLSPLTSYPINNPIHLIFHKPFERLYNNIFLIEDADYYKLIKRAYLVYENFSELLFHEVNYLIGEKSDRLSWKLHEIDRAIDQCDCSYELEDLNERRRSISYQYESIQDIEMHLETLLMIAIFYWNVTARRLDILFDELNKLRRTNKEEKYHIILKDGALKIFDLETDSCVSSSSIEVEYIDTYNILYVSPSGSMNPFAKLEPCNSFYQIGLSVEEKTYDSILADLKSNLAEGLRL